MIVMMHVRISFSDAWDIELRYNRDYSTDYSHIYFNGRAGSLQAYVGCMLDKFIDNLTQSGDFQR